MSSYISFLPALNGDSILLKLNNYIMLIDGGYVNTYNKYIVPELMKINPAGVTINHVIVTHIDSDHISGIIKLFQDNKESAFIKIENIWHNSYKHISHLNPDIEFAGKSLKGLRINYNLKEELHEKVKDVSAVQGSTLASLLIENDYCWNKEFDGKAVSVDNKLEVIISDEIVLKLLSPSEEKLKSLNLDWKKELYKKGFTTSENLRDFSEIAFEQIVSQQKSYKITKSKNISRTELRIDELAKTQFVEDATSSNGSSIAFILEFNNSKALFLADSHPDIIIENLKRHYHQKDFPIYFDLIKISHHGSQQNTSIELLKMITSKKYVFSTNGNSHNHPDKESIARIISLKTPYAKELFFNYPLDSIKSFKNKKLMKLYNYKISEGNGHQPIKIDF